MKLTALHRILVRFSLRKSEYIEKRKQKTTEGSSKKLTLKARNSKTLLCAAAKLTLWKPHSSTDSSNLVFVYKVYKE